MMGGGGRGSAPPLRGRGVSVGPDRGRGRGKCYRNEVYVCSVDLQRDRSWYL